MRAQPPAPRRRLVFSHPTSPHAIRISGKRRYNSKSSAKHKQMLMRAAFVSAKNFVKSMDYHINTELPLASLTATRPRIKLNQVARFDVKRTLRIALDGRRGSG